MITRQEFETLLVAGGTGTTFFGKEEEIDLNELLKQSKSLCSNWQDFYCDNENEVNFRMTEDMRFIYKTTDGDTREADITEYAFSQLCTRLGVPASYVRKCFDNGKIELAVNNFREWSTSYNKTLLIREIDGVVRAVLSDVYKTFDSHKIISTLRNTVDTKRYKANGVFLSEDRFHIRFVDREPLNVNDTSPMFDGFTVSSSDVGRGSLNMTYYLYRQVCKNGMTVSDKQGTLFRQAHAGSEMTAAKINMFNKAFLDMDILNKYSVENIRKNQNTFLRDYELKMYIEKARRDLKLSEKGQEKLVYLIDNTYDRTRWGFLNSVTELAQDYSLDTRILFETFAGNTMMNVA